MKIIKRKPIFFIFLLGLLIRLVLLFYDYSWDINNHISWGKDLFEKAFGGFYENVSSEVFATPYPNYPPLSSFLFYLIYSLWVAIEKITWQINLALPAFPSKLIFFIQSRSFLAALMKLPAVFADLGIAWIIYLFAKKIKTDHRITGKLITGFILFNPAFFYLSALWGQIDSIPVFFSLTAVYLLLCSEKYLLSSVLFLLGILAKPTGLVYLPFYLFFFYYKSGLLKFLKSGILTLIIFFVSFAPFLKNLNDIFLPFKIFGEKILAAQSLPFVTNGAFNFWVLLTGFKGIKDTAPFLFGISYKFWGYIITGLFMVFISMSFPRPPAGEAGKRESRKYHNYFYSTFLIAFTAFLFLTKMHERYSLLPLPFLLLLVLADKKFLKWFILLSTISFLNLYHSWPVPKLGAITDFLYLPPVTFILSLTNCFIFIHLFWRFTKPLFQKHT